MTVRFVDAVSEQVPNTDTTIYTAPSNVNSSIITFGNCNCEDASGSTLTINLVQSGGSVAVTNQYISTKSIASAASDPLTEIVGAVLQPGDFISCVAADANRLNLKIGVKEIY